MSEELQPMARFIKASESQTKWGGNKCPYASGMVEGGWYELESIEVHSSRTALYIKGFKGHFNSVCFELNDAGNEMLDDAHEDFKNGNWYRLPFTQASLTDEPVTQNETVKHNQKAGLI